MLSKASARGACVTSEAAWTGDVLVGAVFCNDALSKAERDISMDVQSERNRQVGILFSK